MLHVFVLLNLEGPLTRSPRESDLLLGKLGIGLTESWSTLNSI